HDPAENPRLGYATSSYAKCNTRAIYFAGPQRKKLVAVSAEDGRLLWTHDDGNVQLVLRNDGLYAMGRVSTSKKFDYMTGKVLADLECFRGNCTRATGAVDSIFARGYRHTGTLRFDVHYETPRRLASMRPACQDGVVSANGQLYWGPWMCDCNHSLVGVISLGSAGDFDFTPAVNDRTRLEQSQPDALQPIRIASSKSDWPTYRRSNTRDAATEIKLPAKMRPQWQLATVPGNQLTAPVTAGDLTFVAGSDGVVIGLETASGRRRWTAYTGGGVRYPPAFWEHRVYVGSADGWVYCFEAQSGRRLWRFRVAPAERIIPVYGRLSSTWPVASGVLVHDGVAYAAAGIASHDGTYVCALDARTGSLKWSNDTSGNLLGDQETVGVSVQGHLLFHDDKLFLAGGNVASPAIYDAETGRCLNQLQHKPEQSKDDHWKMQRSSRGSELFLVDNQVVAAGRMLYKPPAQGPDSRYNGRYELQATSGDVLIQGTNQSLRRLSQTKDDKGQPVSTWETGGFYETMGLALTPQAVLVVGQIGALPSQTGAATDPAPSKDQSTPDRPLQKPQPAIAALDPSNGKTLWSHALPAPPTRWGLAVDHKARVIVTLADGRIVCLAGE
ncbi:MAG: PQQ-binding-like beta-propeller repeat protein, partial [Planctomycetaceae bacterium]